jgi:hypothetical protein
MAGNDARPAEGRGGPYVATVYEESMEARHA